MANIKKSKKTHNIFELMEDIVEERLYDNGRDWSQEEIDLFVSQFNEYQTEEAIVDMNKLDPNFIPLCEFKKKFAGFDDSVIEMLYECENKKLEDARLPPLRISQENISLTNNLSNTIINESEEDYKPKTECDTDCKNNVRGFEKEKEKEKEEEEVSS